MAESHCVVVGLKKKRSPYGARCRYPTGWLGGSAVDGSEESASTRRIPVLFVGSSVLFLPASSLLSIPSAHPSTSNSLNNPFMISVSISTVPASSSHPSSRGSEMARRGGSPVAKFGTSYSGSLVAPNWALRKAAYPWLELGTSWSGSLVARCGVA